jgi:hypothetical protein
MTRAAIVAAFFRERPHVWIDGRDLSLIAGCYAWRTRVADIRRAPYFMTIENRQRRVPRTDGRGAYVVSEYCFRPKVKEASAVSSAPTLLTAV